MSQLILIILQIAIGFLLFWLGQLAYRKLFRRRMELNLELFVKDNPAVAHRFSRILLWNCHCFGRCFRQNPVHFARKIAEFSQLRMLGNFVDARRSLGGRSANSQKL